VGRHRLDPARLRAARGLRRRSKQGLPACRARRPRQEPSVDAPDMEPMVALGEDPDMLSSLKVREADRAHRVGSIELQPRRVDHDRHGSDGLPLQPALSQTCHRVRHGINNRSARAPQRTPDYRVEPERTDQCPEKNSQDHDDVCVEVASKKATICGGGSINWLARTRGMPGE